MSATDYLNNALASEEGLAIFIIDANLQMN